MALFQSKQKHIEQLMEELRQEQLQEELEKKAAEEAKWKAIREQAKVEEVADTVLEPISEDSSFVSIEENISEEPVSEDFISEEPVIETFISEESTIEESSEEPLQEKKSFWQRLVDGLAKTRENFTSSLNSIFSGHTKIDDDFYEELEEILVMGDVGITTTENIIDDLKDKVKENHIKDPMDCRDLLIDSIKEQMTVDETAYDFEKQLSVVMVIGVNGVGKTTSVGKLAGVLKNNGRKVLIAAADTFRAAASDQLATWADRAGVPMVRSTEGADPASVVFDACSAAKARNIDTLLIDTAGRLHNKKNLMEELRKMNRIIDREFPDAKRENFIVLDAATGQNAMVQAKEFGDVTELTGIILTKMDGTAKGGIAIAIQSELKVPVKYIGVGETIEDLQKFNADDFVNALFATDNSDIAED